ncbi:alanine--tRNA ligase [Coriobacteriia bacterium Es71-Z0120]|uniref:alanine--tRNA ligase n=1 Tax=Parvivirga hydrogeniphila TaxID=2939460 RepID=UPI00226093CD|nr:alanine--tRNA ligase [Parvivirga hydrogeniphila]MCL4079170.1 alanine--tRNA ligase [Parvivirga hydrogeniphila]
MKSAEIRESFLQFFEGKGCTRVPSSSLVPDDPSLLLTSAGMVQFKPVFLGLVDPGYTRATTCQKCARTTDIDIIGTTGRHHSFFEMLGNFSFGDYFKSEACAWAYEYSTQVLGLDPDRLWFSIYEDDDEAEAVWRDEVGVPAERIVRMGAKDNFWSAGPTGPCGPCSELYYDQGPEVGCGSPDCAPGCDCDRFLEYWNLVFMQYDRQEDGTLVPLPKKNIDTGMGLERVAAIMQGVHSNFETDILRGILAVAERISGVEYGRSAKTDTSLRILTDHARAVTFLIADGVLPSNESRGYVLRRLLRRAVRHGRLLGVERPFLGELVDEVVARMGDAYPEIVEHHGLVKRIVLSEEERFGATLKQGLALLTSEIERTKTSGASTLDGGFAFMLHDTYGFPFELTSEIAGESGLSVDHEAFERHMHEQRERARAAVQDESWSGISAAFAEIGKRLGGVEFVGYAKDECDTVVAGIVVGGEQVETIEAGTEAEVVLAATPFYGEQGGQVGDTGIIASERARFVVNDAKVPAPGVISHVGVLESGTLSVGDSVHAAIDVARRERIRRNHTATHILHWALRTVLGEHVRQSGSLVAPDRLRFDFTHFEAPGAEALQKIERLVNAKIMENHPVRNYETSLATAREMGVTALFGEKYGEIVRVLEVGNFSKELCGGTHVGRTSEIGFLKIVSEGSIGANLRRIEAVTSFDALEFVYREEAVLAELERTLKARTAELPGKVEALLERVKQAEARAKAAATRSVDAAAVPEAVAAAGYTVRIGRVDGLDAQALRALADELRAASGAVFLASVNEGAVLLVAAGTDEAVAKGFDAGALVREAARIVGGGGGGKPAFAQAGGKDPGAVDDALARVRAALGTG